MVPSPQDLFTEYQGLASHIFSTSRMERLVKPFRNYKNANEAFRRASANVHSRWPTYLYGPRNQAILKKEYQTAHQRMLNAYQRRSNAAHAFHVALGRSGLRIPGANRMTAYQIMNAVNRMYAPPNRPGGFGGSMYEAAALRYRKKPNRAKSASPNRRRRSPVKRASSARF